MQTKFYPIFLHVALIVLAATTLGLAKQNRALLAALTPEQAQLEIGETVGPADLQTLAGALTTMRWGEETQDRLLFVFTTQHCCPTNFSRKVKLLRVVGGRRSRRVAT